MSTNDKLRELADVVLAWWKDHEYDVYSGNDGDERNTYDETPEFVKVAQAALGADRIEVDEGLCEDEGCPHHGTDHVCNPPAQAAQASNAELMAEWFRADGSVHGPNVETVTMPQAKYLAFRRSIGQPHSPDAANSGRVTEGSLSLRIGKDLENPRFWLDGLRVAIHVTDCAAKQQALTNAERELRKFCEAALAARPQSPASPVGVPDGWINDPDTIPKSIINACRDAICREFGNNGTDGYYKRILAKVFAALAAAPSATPEGGEISNGA